jgi:hypothetical protein
MNCQVTYILISDLGVITFSLVTKETTSLNKESAKCKDYKSSDLDFIQCSKKKVWSMMESAVNCTIVGLIYRRSFKLDFLPNPFKKSFVVSFDNFILIKVEAYHNE